MENILKTITVIWGLIGLIGVLSVPYGFACFLGSCLSGFLARYLAGKKDYDKDWAFIYGWVWGLVASIYYLVCDKNINA